MEKVKLSLMGMNCGHCVASVQRALGGIDGVSVEDVKINSATFEFDASKASLEDIKKTLGEVGYPVKSAAAA